MDLLPLFSRIIVQQTNQVKEEDVTTTPGGLIVPIMAQNRRKSELKAEMATEGTVVAKGNEVDSIDIGDIVFYGKFSGAEIERGGEKFIVMNEEDVIAKVKMA